MTLRDKLWSKSSDRHARTGDGNRDPAEHTVVIPQNDTSEHEQEGGSAVWQEADDPPLNDPTVMQGGGTPPGPSPADRSGAGSGWTVLEPVARKTDPYPAPSRQPIHRREERAQDRPPDPVRPPVFPPPLPRSIVSQDSDATIGPDVGAPGRESVIGVLIGIEGPYAGRVYRLFSRQTRIGRSTCDPAPDAHHEDKRVSREHAVVIFVGGEARLRHGTRTSTTEVNGSALGFGDSTPLRDGDEVSLGRDSRFVYRVTRAPGPRIEPQRSTLIDPGQRSNAGDVTVQSDGPPTNLPSPPLDSGGEQNTEAYHRANEERSGPSPLSTDESGNETKLYEQARLGRAGSDEG